MKNTLLTITMLSLLIFSSFGQAPEGFKYQAVIRDGSNMIMSNQSVGIRLSLQQGAIGGMLVYSETFTTTTNSYGLVNLEIGTGTSSYDFTIIDWSNGPFFMETAVDLTGGTSYSVMGTSQLMSVPYALYAKTADSVVNDNVIDADADPSNELQNLSISGDTIFLSNGGFVQQADPVIEATGGLSSICSGSTTPGVGWQVYDPNTIYLQVNTSGCGYSTTARYFTSVGGTGSHFELTGVSAIYAPTPTGFQVYVQKNSLTPLSPSDAVSGQWFINWQSIGH